MWCPKCGWGGKQGKSIHEVGEPDEPGKPSLVWVILGWVYSVCFVAGPYVALLIYLPDVEMWVHYTYWAVMVLWLMAAAALDPSPDMSELGWAGGLINNPFSYEDDINRNKLLLALILIPAKMVIATLSMTWRFVLGS